MRALLLAVAVTLIVAAPASARQNQDIVETATAVGQFTTLTKLLKKAGLVSALQQPGPYTVFAPTDKAFAKVPKRKLKALARDKAKLKSVLLYHVVAKKLPAAKVVERKRAKTLNGQRVRLRVRGGNVFVNRAKVTAADVMASNGVIHVINRVLLPR
jgi:uncharacterized surface protein with fasciclin (FAS1) repeats